MEFCRNCGTKLNENQDFCSECGQPANRPKSATPSQSTTNQPSNGSKQPFFKSKKSKILTICGVILFALLAGGYYVMQQMTAPKAVADAFIEAINKKDTAAMQKFINDGQYEIKADDKETQQFIDYLHENPRMITSIAEGLLNDAKKYEGNLFLKEEKESTPLASLKLDGKKWILFDHYTIQIQTFYTDITSDLDKTDIYINNKKAGTMEDDEETFGPFLPGEYTVKAVVNGEYGKVEQKLKIDTADVDGATEMIDFDWSDYFVPVYSDHDDSILYVNNKSTKQEVGELEEIGPVLLDGSVKVFAQKKFGESVKKSNVVTLKEGIYSAELLFDYEEEVDMVSTDYLMESPDGTDHDETAVENVVLTHYSKISSDDFHAAYQLFSSDRKSKVTLDGWTKGLQENIRDIVTELNVTKLDGNTAKAYVEMTSYDEQSDGTTLVQEWGGSWNLVKESNGWRLDKADLEKLDSRIE